MGAPGPVSETWESNEPRSTDVALNLAERCLLLCFALRHFAGTSVPDPVILSDPERSEGESEGLLFGL
jgi:hypothetical protein